MICFRFFIVLTHILNFICVGGISFIFFVEFYFSFKLESHTRLTCVTDLLEEGRKAFYRQYFIVGFFIGYDPTTTKAKLRSPDARESRCITLDLTGVPTQDLPIEDQLCHVFGRCQWRDGGICIQVHYIKTSVRWNYTVYEEIMFSRKRFMKSVSNA